VHWIFPVDVRRWFHARYYWHAIIRPRDTNVRGPVWSLNLSVSFLIILCYRDVELNMDLYMTHFADGHPASAWAYAEKAKRSLGDSNAHCW